jgi:hypothetical protein
LLRATDTAHWHFFTEQKNMQKLLTNEVITNALFILTHAYWFIIPPFPYFRTDVFLSRSEMSNSNLRYSNCILCAVLHVSLPIMFVYCKLAECPQCYCGETREMLTFLINLSWPKANHVHDRSMGIVEYQRKTYRQTQEHLSSQYRLEWLVSKIFVRILLIPSVWI